MLPMMDAASWTFVFIMCVGCGIACTAIASRKGYRGGQLLGWLAAGMIFGVFGLIAAVLTQHGEEG